MAPPKYYIKKYADNGENPKLLRYFNENDTLYVLSSKPTAKYSKWDVLETGKLQKDEKLDFRTPALAIKYPNLNIPFPVGSANDIDDIFIEDSGTGAQIEAEDFPLYKALKRMGEIGYTIDDIVAEIRRHSKDEDQRKRLLRTFLLDEISLDGGDFVNPREIVNNMENGQFDELINILADLDREFDQVLDLLNINQDDNGMQVGEERNGSGAD